MVDGVLSSNRNNVVVSSKTGKEYKVKEVGLLTPGPHPCPLLYPGQVGYLITNMKNAREAEIGDTLYVKDKPLIDIELAKVRNHSNKFAIYFYGSFFSQWCLLEYIHSIKVKPRN